MNNVFTSLNSHLKSVLQFTPKANCYNVFKRANKMRAPKLHHSIPLFQRQDGIEIHLATQTEDIPDKLAHILAIAFCEEPASRSLVAHKHADPQGLYPTWRQFVDHFMEECCSNEMSVIAIDKNTNELAGAFILRDFASEVPQKLLDECNKNELKPLVHCLTEVDEEYLKMKYPNGLQKGEVVDFWMVSVAPNHRKKGLMGLMTEYCTSLAKQKGFKTAMAEATGAFSLAAFQNLGFEPVLQKEWASFEFNDTKPFKNIAHPHKYFTIVEKPL